MGFPPLGNFYSYHSALLLCITDSFAVLLHHLQ